VADDNSPISVDDIDGAPSSLPAPAPTMSPKEIEELRDSFNRVTSEKADLEDDNFRLKRALASKERLDSLIAPYANRSFWFMCVYCAVVAGLLIASGIKSSGFQLEDGVLKVLTGSTGVTVIGLVGMVLTGIFVGARKG
jgi:hypothetical protein